MKRLFALMILASAAPVLAEDYRLGDLVIANPHAIETRGYARTGVGYLTITNAGDTPDRLVEVRADFPKVMIHATEQTDGVARMVHLGDGIDIPPGDTVTLAPGATHVMFMGLDGAAFVAGETVPATLVFESAGPLDVLFSIRPLDGGGNDGS